MKAYFTVLLVLCLGLLAGACRRQDMRVVEIATPGIRCDACVSIARRALLHIDGVDESALWFDTQSGTTRVRYDSMMAALKNLELALNDVGFDANDMPADPDAIRQLPAECREHTDR